MSEPYKWELNPEATLRELGRMDEQFEYRSTICGNHRMLWALINVDLNGYIPEEKLEELNEILERAFKMGKRMDYRLKQYYLKEHGLPDVPESYPPGGLLSEKMTMAVDFPDKEPIRKKRKFKGEGKPPKDGDRRVQARRVKGTRVMKRIKGQ